MEREVGRVDRLLLLLLPLPRSLSRFAVALVLLDLDRAFFCLIFARSLVVKK